MPPEQIAEAGFFCCFPNPFYPGSTKGQLLTISFNVEVSKEGSGEVCVLLMQIVHGACSGQHIPLATVILPALFRSWEVCVCVCV